MKLEPFDELTEYLAGDVSRRRVMGGMARSVLGAIAAGLLSPLMGGPAQAKEKDKDKKPPKPCDRDKDCDSGLACCGGICRDLQSDRFTCGSCDHRCGSLDSGNLQSCVNGACVCPPEYEICGLNCCRLQGLSSVSNQRCCGGACTFINVDQANCGQCGNVCRSGQICRDGECVCPDKTCGDVCCPPGEDCSSGACTAVLNDGNNCGVCGRACGEAQTCNDGVCECYPGACSDHCPCPGGSQCCGGQCIPAGDHCCAGSKPCPSTSVCCGEYCVTAYSSVTGLPTPEAVCCTGEPPPRHAIACDKEGPLQQDCVNGQCVPKCGSGETRCENGVCCSGECVNGKCEPARGPCQQREPSGLCQSACGPDQTCCKGQCAGPCDATQCQYLHVSTCQCVGCGEGEDCVSMRSLAAPTRSVRGASASSAEGGQCLPRCGPCTQRGDDGSCVPVVCGDCQVCDPATGGCVPLDCGSPCLECRNNACYEKVCPTCQVCDGAEGCVPVDCGPCAVCQNNTCVSTCGPCQICSAQGVCVSTCAGPCQTCDTSVIPAVCGGCKTGEKCCNGYCQPSNTACCPAGSKFCQFDGFWGCISPTVTCCGPSLVSCRDYYAPGGTSCCPKTGNRFGECGYGQDNRLVCR